MARLLSGNSRLPIDKKQENRAKTTLTSARSLANIWLSFPQNDSIWVVFIYPSFSAAIPEMRSWGGLSGHFVV
jgi:hypothetical protein